MKHTWQELQDKVVEWKQGKNVTLEGTLEHLLDEIKDLRDNPYDVINIADVFILLLGVCDEVGFSIDEVSEAVAAKIAINESRLWGNPDERGVVRHIQETKM